MALIGLMGSIGSGKTTGADYLVQTHGFKDKAFADPLKRLCKELFLFENSQLYGTQAQKMSPDLRWFGCSARRSMQFVGTDLLRNRLGEIMPGLGTDIFVHHFKLWYEQFRQTDRTTDVVISDVLFQNEVDAIRQLGGIVVRIHRKNKIPESNGENLTMTYVLFAFSYLIIYFVGMYVCNVFSCANFELFTYGLILVALSNFIYVCKRDVIIGPSHQSETELLKIIPDYAIHNDGPYSDFYKSLESILGLIKLEANN